MTHEYAIVELNRETFVNERGGTSEKVTEIRQIRCNECGYDRHKVVRDTYTGLFRSCRCNACGESNLSRVPKELGRSDK